MSCVSLLIYAVSAAGTSAAYLERCRKIHCTIVG